MGKALVLIGLLVTGVGLLMMLGLPLGRLPGDIMYRRGNVTFYFPLGTCILVSLILTLVFTLLRR
jgi:predicted MFS family arabinose efflux permease